MDNNEESDIRYNENAPLFYKYLEKIDKKDIRPNSKSKFIKIDFYQTDEFEPFPFYKPISKIISTSL